MAEQKKRKRRWGDRNDGRRLRTISPYMAITPFIMPQRNDACNQFSDSIEITETDRFLRTQRKEGMKGLGMLHLFVAAYVRAVSQYPSLNRFISGQRVYARNNIEVVMTIKRSLDPTAEESSIKVALTPADTLPDVYRKMEDAIADIKNNVENGTDKLAGLIMSMPRFLINFAVKCILRPMDYLFGLPKPILNASPFHGSMIITDIGSLGIPPIYHHIYNFGNLSVFVSFGAKYRKMEVDLSGAMRERKYIDFKVNTDERITDGSNYAAAFKIMRRCVAHPEQLMTPPEVVREDVE